MAQAFTRYQLRERAKALGIAVRYGQFATYITKGLLPDPDEEVWIEEAIVPRFLRIHELDETTRSLDRRVVVLYLERYPVPPAKLRDAMVGMLPTIKRPVRKMARVEAARRWFGAHFGRGDGLRLEESSSAEGRPPPLGQWGEVLRAADLEVFAHRLGITTYYMELLKTLGKGTAHALDDLDPAETLVLLTIAYFADWHRAQQHAREERDAARQDAQEKVGPGAMTSGRGEA